MIGQEDDLASWMFVHFIHQVPPLMADESAGLELGAISAVPAANALRQAPLRDSAKYRGRPAEVVL